MTFRPYADYRDSGVDLLGKLPSDWDVLRLRHAAALNPSKSEVADLPDDLELSFLPMEAVGETGELDLSRTRPLAEVRNGYSYFADGDVVFAKVTPCLENGKGALIRDLIGGRGFGTTELTVIRPNDVADGPYLWWVTYSHVFRGPASGEMTGAGGLKRVPDDFVRDFSVPWPSPRERAAIAAFLDRETAKIDALVEEQRRLIELLKEKRQAVISHAVTKGLDPSAPMKDSCVEWLGEVPAHWEVNRFSRFVNIAEGQVDPREEPYSSMVLIAPNHIEQGTGRLLFVETASEQGADSGKYEVRTGDVVYSKIRPALSKAVLAPCGGLCSADMYPLRGRDGMQQEYLLNLLLCPGFTAWAVLESERVAMPKINREKLNELRVPLPPPAEQAAISARIKAARALMDPLVVEAESAIELLNERRSALISAAVTGKIDVRDTAPKVVVA